jgi:hypothetical protein
MTDPLSPPPAPAPPPPPPSARGSEAAIWVLPLLATLVVAILLLRRVDAAPELLRHDLVPLWCSFVLTYVGCAAISLLPAPLGQRVDGILDRHLLRWGSGLYGVVALSVFLRLEILSFIETLREWPGGNSLWRGLLRDWLIGFSIESLRNAISAVTWPASVVIKHGWQGLAGFGLASSAVFGLGRRLLPGEHARVEKPETPQSDSKE